MTSPNEQERLLELFNLELLDTPYEEDFNDIVALASQICNAPISLITLVDKHRQWFKAKVGLNATETSRETSFCAHAIAGDYELFEVEDATQDERFFDNPLVTSDPNIKFYAGVPLITSNGHKLGTLCVINSQPQKLQEQQCFALKVLANQVVKLAEQRLMNRYLDDYKKRLETQAQAQNKIISIMAHDVRSPLTSLKNILELDEEGLINQEERKQLTSLSKKQLENTLELLNSLVDWGKALVKTSKVDTKSMNLHQLVGEKLRIFEVTASLKKIKLVNEVPEGVMANTDENALRFILRNLLSNAVKYTENGGITVSAERKDKRLLLTVSDSGVGMTEQQAANLEKGMGHSSTKGTQNEPGSGLGFMLTRDFIQMLNGTITVKSQQNNGTTVLVEIDA